MFAKIIELLNTDDPVDLARVMDMKKLKSPDYRGLWTKHSGNYCILYRIDPSVVGHWGIHY